MSLRVGWDLESREEAGAQGPPEGLKGLGRGAKGSDRV